MRADGSTDDELDSMKKEAGDESHPHLVLNIRPQAVIAEARVLLIERKNSVAGHQSAKGEWLKDVVHQHALEVALPTCVFYAIEIERHSFISFVLVQFFKVRWRVWSYAFAGKILRLYWKLGAIWGSLRIKAYDLVLSEVFWDSDGDFPNTIFTFLKGDFVVAVAIDVAAIGFSLLNLSLDQRAEIFAFSIHNSPNYQ